MRPQSGADLQGGRDGPRLVAQHPEPARAAVHASRLEVPVPKPLLSAFQGMVQAFLAGPQLSLGHLQGRDVPGDTGNAVDAAPLVPDGGEDGLEGPDLLGDEVLFFELERSTLIEDPAKMGYELSRAAMAQAGFRGASGEIRVEEAARCVEGWIHGLEVISPCSEMPTT